MSSAFKETVKARLAQNKAKYPLLKRDDLFDWQGLGCSGWWTSDPDSSK